MCGFIAQLVEHRTGIAEVTGSNPVEALIFFRLLLSNCLNWKIYCDDHSSLHLLPQYKYELFHIYFAICDIVAGSKGLTVANIYAPNEDNPNFFHSFFDHLSSFRGEEIIIGGDFNLVLDVKKDERGGLARTRQKALKVIHDFSENLCLTDIWRLFNPEAKR